jgi:hypothetical protein
MFTMKPVFAGIVSAHKSANWLEAWHCYRTLDFEKIYPGFNVIHADLLELLAL